MNLIGQQVEHKAFGAGVVADLTDSIVTVSFQDRIKKFVYPDGFRGFLVLKDQTARRFVEKQIRERERAMKKAQESEQKAREKIRKQENFKVLANSHAIFHVAPEQISRIVRTGRVSAGTYLSGDDRGLPRIAERIRPNSACLLTTRPAAADERERSIIGLFMVREDFFGEDARDGVIESHGQHRVFLPEGRRLPFWNYFSAAMPQRWGNAAFKYCSGDLINAVLSDMTAQLSLSGQEEGAVEAYRYFCKINRLRPLIELEKDGQ